MKKERAISGNWKFSFVLCTLYSVLFFSCNKEEPVPAYIRIDKFTLNADYAAQGSASHKIMDAWIYVDDQLVGAFELPCTVPVLYEGTHVIKIHPGIQENGISETRIPYPFYTRHEQSADLVAGEITVIDPVTGYASAADFSWIEDYEGLAHGFCTSAGTGDPDTVMTIYKAPAPEVFELTGSGGVVLANTSYMGESCNKYILPKGGAPVFLELDYNCNSDFNVGIRGYAGSNLEFQGISLSLRPTTGWNKVYVNLSNEVSGATTSSAFTIFVSMVKDPALPDSRVYLDNIKLIN